MLSTAGTSIHAVLSADDLLERLEVFEVLCTTWFTGAEAEKKQSSAGATQHRIDGADVDLNRPGRIGSLPLLRQGLVPCLPHRRLCTMRTAKPAKIR